MDLLWWHWIAAGIVLVISELFVPMFFILWFGVGAIMVGVVMRVVPLSSSMQFFLWAIFSIAMVVAWFRFFKNPDKTKAGISKEAFIGETGLITKEVSAMAKGVIRFQKPILGSDTWPVIADETIPSGERAKIVDVIGQTLKVLKA
ncbi:NfeD family protein [Sulfurirhabdus autotrophica]|uniref:Uncharacterized protein n=1 Tax=Sulfurirhabdus autotrophica TaxID=1706046 RepID=A0A4R3XVW1_9PROT|nr:NfeD family protein [Sulfurirhabdus autotrophica]TCV83320.1 hypothetical protein EDC63_11671 [Sulfurirhabdus autotrophica]